MPLKSGRSMAVNWQQTSAKTRAVQSFLSVKEGRGLFGAGEEGAAKDYNPLQTILRRNDALINVKGSFHIIRPELCCKFSPYSSNLPYTG